MSPSATAPANTLSSALVNLKPGKKVGTKNLATGHWMLCEVLEVVSLNNRLLVLAATADGGWKGLFDAETGELAFQGVDLNDAHGVATIRFVGDIPEPIAQNPRILERFLEFHTGQIQ